MLDTITSDILNGSFPSPSQFPPAFFFACPDLNSAKYINGTLYRSLLCSFLFSSIALWTLVASVSLDLQFHLLNPASPLTSTRSPHAAWLLGNSLKAVYWGPCRADLIFLFFSRMLVSYEPLFHIVLLIGYFRWRVSLVPAPIFWL